MQLYRERTVSGFETNPVVIALYGGISTSQLSHGFYSAWDSTALVLYVLPRAPPLEVYTYSPCAVQIPYTVKTMIQLLLVHVHVHVHVCGTLLSLPLSQPSQVEDDFDLSYPQLFERVFVVGLKKDPASKKLVTEVTYTFPPRPPCMGYVQHEDGTIPCTVKTMKQLSCMDRPYKATARLASAPEYNTCTLAVQRKVR